MVVSDGPMHKQDEEVNGLEEAQGEGWVGERGAQGEGWVWV